MAAYGLLGGTFDPVHIGHLRAAIESREHLGLDRVDLLPAADPPLKATPQTSAAHRAAMASAAVQDLAGVGVDTRELARPGVSYTVDTLRSWRAEHGARDALAFIVGEDVLPSLPDWYRWEELLEHCHLVVLVRPGRWRELPPLVDGWLAAHRGAAQALGDQPAGTVVRLAQPPLEVSSTQLRAALGAGEDLQCLLPTGVLEYIRAHGLYGASDAPPDRE